MTASTDTPARLPVAARWGSLRSFCKPHYRRSWPRTAMPSFCRASSACCLSGRTASSLTSPHREVRRQCIQNRNLYRYQRKRCPPSLKRRCLPPLSPMAGRSRCVASAIRSEATGERRDRTGVAPGAGQSAQQSDRRRARYDCDLPGAARLHLVVMVSSEAGPRQCAHLEFCRHSFPPQTTGSG